MRKIILFHICFLLLTHICFGQSSINNRIDIAESYRLTKQTNKALKDYKKLYKKVSRKDSLFIRISDGLLQTILDSIVHLRESDNYSKKIWNKTISMAELYFQVYEKDKSIININKKRDIAYRDREFYIYQDMILAYNGINQFDKASLIKSKIYDRYFTDIEEYGANSFEKYFYFEKFIYKKFFIESAEYFNDFNDEEKKSHLLKQTFGVYPIDPKGKINYDSCLYSLEVLKPAQIKSDTVNYILAKRYYLKKKRADVIEYIPTYTFNTPIDNKTLHQIILDYLDNKVKTSGEIIYIQEW